MIDKETKAVWLANLNVGDKCALRQSMYATEPYDIMTVAKITATQLVMTRDKAPAVILRARRDTGRMIGRSYSNIEPITKAIREVNEMASLASWARDLGHSYKHLTADQLRRMKAIADERQ